MYGIMGKKRGVSYYVGLKSLWAMGCVGDHLDEDLIFYESLQIV